MKQICIVLLLFVSLSVSSQRLIRGYAVAYSYGFLSSNEDFSVTYQNTTYGAVADKATSGSLFFGFPLEYGYSRHRFTLLPAVDLTTASWKLDFGTDENVPFGRSLNDSIAFKSFIIMPQIGLHYRYHFFIGKLHFALGGGLDLKIPVSTETSLTDKDKLDYAAEFIYDTNYSDNSIFAIASDPGMCISPRIGFDVYLSRFLVVNVFYYRSRLNQGLNNSFPSGHFSGGISYLLPFGKEDDARVLQQYKKQ